MFVGAPLNACNYFSTSKSAKGQKRKGSPPTKHNKIKMAHIVELEDAERIVDQGVNILAHNVRDKDIPDDFIATLKQKNVSVISTLAREEAMFTFGDGPNGPAFIDDPFFQNALSSERLRSCQDH